MTIQSEQIEGWIVVTGAGRGIGAGIARRLCERGACVMVADLDLASAEETAARLCRDGHRAQAGHVDVTEETSVEALGDVTLRLGKLVGWVNNAGISEVIPLTDMSVEAWDRMMSVNVRGVFLGTRAAARRIGSGGAIVNLASVSSVIAFPHRSHYGASKGAVVAFTKHAAIDLAPRGIRVNAVGPGTIESQMTHGRLSDPEQLRWTLQRVPAGRVGQPEDIGNAVAFLCSRDAAYITGVVLMCDGGWTAAA